MDIATLLGLFGGMTVVVFAVLSGSDLWLFLNVPGFLIVMGGTFAATLIKFPIGNVLTALKIGTKAAFVSEKESPRELIDIALDLAKKVRTGGLLALEEVQLDNDFFQKGVQLCVDGHNIDVVRDALTAEMDLTIQRHTEGSKIFRGIGETAPAFGMIGTLIGLVQMLSNMEDPKTIGPAMAIALLTTLYGALIANLIALPIADKLESKVEQEGISKTLIMESILQIHGGQNPLVLEELLEAYLPENQRQSRDEGGDE